MKNNHQVEVITRYASGTSVPHYTSQNDLLKQIKNETQMRLDLWMDSEGELGYDPFYLVTGLKLDNKTKKLMSVTFTEVL